MKKELRAIFKVRLGETVSEVAAELEVHPNTLSRWVKNYKRPDKQVVHDLILEVLVDSLNSGIKGSEFTGIINALKVVGNDGEQSLLKVLMGEPDQDEADEQDWDDLTGIPTPPP